MEHFNGSMLGQVHDRVPCKDAILAYHETTAAENWIV